MLARHRTRASIVLGIRGKDMRKHPDQYAGKARVLMSMAFVRSDRICGALRLSHLCQMRTH